MTPCSGTPSNNNSDPSREAAENALLAKISRIITSSPDIDEVYEKFAEALKAYIDFDRIVIGTVDLERWTTTVSYIVGTKVANRAIGYEMPLSGTHVEAVVRDRSGMIVQPNSMEESAVEYPGLVPLYEAGLRSFLTVPLIAEDEAIGVLLLRSCKPHAYTKQDLELAERVGAQIAGAIANAQLHAQIQKEANERAVLAEIGRIINSSLAINDVFERFAGQVRHLWAFDRIAIGVIDCENEVLVSSYVSGVDVTGWAPLGESRPLNNSLMLELFDNRSGILYCTECEPGEPSIALHKPGIKAGFSSFMEAPLIANDERVGSLHLRSFQACAYSEFDLALLRRVGDQIAGAISNAQLHAQAQREATEKRVLAEIGRAVTASLDIEVVGERVADQIAALIHFDRISITTVDLDAQILVHHFVRGVEVPGWRRGDVSSLSSSINQKAIRSKKAHFINSPPRGIQAIAEAAGLHSGIAVPLISDDEVIGAMDLRSRQPDTYTVQDLELAERIGRQIAGAMVNARLEAQRQEAEQTLRASEAKFRGLLEAAPGAIIIVDSNGAIQFVNTQTEETFGYTRGELLGQQLSVLLPAGLRKEHDKHRAEYMRDPHIRAMGAQFNIAGCRKDGSSFPADVKLSPMHSDEGLLVISTVRDITERRQLEDQLRHSQKMDAVGQLAGGVAHDFNNMLSVVTSYSEMLMSKLQGEEKLLTYLREIRKAADRATNLTRQLLAFSHRQVIQQKIVDLNSLIVDCTNMLRRLISENIELVILPSQSLGMVKVDPSQIEQVLINLVVNSRDAMPLGGKLIIETEEVVLDEVYARSHPDVSAGTYVMVKVQDEGEGIPADVLPHIFEPFYTTKEQGKGTGLGLSTCYGIIAQSGGHIAVDSTYKKGTTFRVYLPLVAESVSPETLGDLTHSLPTGGETILLVEDEPLVRSVATEVLTDRGYTVIQAENGAVALHLIEENPDQPIDLILTDLIMPFIGGKELVERIKTVRPDMCVMYTSGYTPDDRFQAMLMEPDVEFLPKPFSPATLTRKVRANLDRCSPSNV